MEDGEFQIFLSKVASRLRHDLKGGLITLKMGLESLPDEEALKPLLLEKSQELVDLSDKLVLLLRMGQLTPQRVGPASLFQQAANQAQNLFSPLEVVVVVWDPQASASAPEPAPPQTTSQPEPDPTPAPQPSQSTLTYTVNLPESILRCRYFANDEIANGIVEGDTRDYRFSDLYLGVGHHVNIDPHKFQYKLLSALRMLGFKINMGFVIAHSWTLSNINYSLPNP